MDVAPKMMKPAPASETRGVEEVTASCELQSTTVGVEFPHHARH
jgi:hypothetical protein